MFSYPHTPGLQSTSHIGFTDTVLLSQWENPVSRRLPSLTTTCCLCGQQRCYVSGIFPLVDLMQG